MRGERECEAGWHTAGPRRTDHARVHADITISLWEKRCEKGASVSDWLPAERYRFDDRAANHPQLRHQRRLPSALPLRSA